MTAAPPRSPRPPGPPRPPTDTFSTLSADNAAPVTRRWTGTAPGRPRRSPAAGGAQRAGALTGAASRGTVTVNGTLARVRGGTFTSVEASVSHAPGVEPRSRTVTVWPVGLLRDSRSLMTVPGAPSR
ncbi:hypothetical protein O1L68_25435 [Streptomyces lydicus]|nr:hypothetical protein [Streptomyces lydicus]